MSNGSIDIHDQSTACTITEESLSVQGLRRCSQVTESYRNQPQSRTPKAMECTRGCIWFDVKCYGHRNSMCQQSIQPQKVGSTECYRVQPGQCEASVHTITKYSPGRLVLQRDIIVHKKVIADWEPILHARRRAQQIRDDERKIKSRTSDEYKAGDKVRSITTARERKGKLIGFEHPGP